MTDAERERIHSIVYSCDSRTELAERIVALEGVARGMAQMLDGFCHVYHGDCRGCPAWPPEAEDCGLHGAEVRLAELGVGARG